MIHGPLAELFLAALREPSHRAHDVPRKPAIIVRQNRSWTARVSLNRDETTFGGRPVWHVALASLNPRGLPRKTRCYLAAQLGHELLGERGAIYGGTRCEYTDPRAEIAAAAVAAGHSPAELAKLPQEIVHVRRALTASEERHLPEWFADAEPLDGGSGTPIRFP